LQKSAAAPITALETSIFPDPGDDLRVKNIEALSALSCSKDNYN